MPCSCSDYNSWESPLTLLKPSPHQCISEGILLTWSSWCVSHLASFTPTPCTAASLTASSLVPQQPALDAAAKRKQLWLNQILYFTQNKSPSPTKPHKLSLPHYLAAITFYCSAPQGSAHPAFWGFCVAQWAPCPHKFLHFFFQFLVKYHHLNETQPDHSV